MRFLVLIIFLYASLIFAQQRPLSYADSLKNLLQITTSDKEKVMIYIKLIDPADKAFWHLKMNEQFEFAQTGYDLAKKIGFEAGQIRCALGICFVLTNQETQQAILFATEAKQLSEKNKDTLNLIRSYCFLGNAYTFYNYRKSLAYYFTAWEWLKKLKLDDESFIPIYAPIGYTYKEAGILDSAFIFLKKGYELSLSGNTIFTPDSYYFDFGEIYYKQNKFDSAMYYFRRSLAAGQTSRGHTHYFIAQIKKQENQLDSAKYYGKVALELCLAAKDNQYIPFIGNFLYNLYKDVDSVQAWKYRLIALEAKDKMYDQEKTQHIERIAFEEREKVAELERQAEAFHANTKFSILLGSLLGVILISLILARNNRQKQKANTLLQQQKEEIDQKSYELEKSLIQIKSTQAQLIQSEKMASLGELTAGIAHEIQNPLNFVTNFSEINNDLVNEANKEIKTLNNQYPMLNAQGLQETLTDIKINSEKINQHGLRASNIVKSMLEHSRPSSGKKEPTDLNKLCDEFIRLSFHGLKAKDKSFECNYSMDLEPNLPLVDVVSQDIGRVILNLVNNAFQACAERSLSATRERSKLKEAGGKEIEDIPSSFSSIPYSPNVTVITKHKDDKIEIIVSDNGSGIPDSIKEKIFQPFFTTKPTGQGTGLGLSLAYDIVKAHSGEIVLHNGQETTFTVKLPTNRIMI